MGTVAEIVIKRREQEREGGGRENVREGERGGEGRGERGGEGEMSFTVYEKIKSLGPNMDI